MSIFRRALSLGAFSSSALLALASCSTLPFQRPPISNDPVIMAVDEVPLDSFLNLVESRNPGYGRRAWTQVWQAYADACRSEGVSQAVALAQMLHETNWLKFGGTVRLEQNNFAGLGTVDKNTPGLSFPDVRTGALAHVQHLKAYASLDGLRGPSADPRFRFVKRGSAPTLRALTGKWAADPAYGEKLLKLYRQLKG